MLCLYQTNLLQSRSFFSSPQVEERDFHYHFSFGQTVAQFRWSNNLYTVSLLGDTVPRPYFPTSHFSLGDHFSKKAPGRSLRAVKEMTISRPKYEVGRNTLWYRDPVIWNVVNKIAEVSESRTSFKNTIRKLQADLEASKLRVEIWANKVIKLFIIWLQTGKAREIERTSGKFTWHRCCQWCKSEVRSLES